MRPIHLSISGYTVFRDETQVDFSDADVFAFTGATGSGKSSLVDAMGFALYGAVPRLDRRAVAPIVSLGRNEARVLFEFSVGGDTYRAARVVRRTKTGATTKEARLERSDGQVLAGNERELTAQVERLLGLGFDQFTTCVVLPQNEFMRLLHDEPAKRQDLLVRLLDLGLYERMARRARGREQWATQQAEVAHTLLDKLAFATLETLDQAVARVRCLERLRDDVEAAAPRLDTLAREAEDHASRAAEARREAQLLAGVEVPEGSADLARALVATQLALEEAEREAESRSVDSSDAEAVLAELPDRSALEAAQRAHHARAELLTQQEKCRLLLAEREVVKQRSAATFAEAETALERAAQRLERALWEHRARDLAESLVPGEPCPVCCQVVVEAPEGHNSGAVEDARRVKRSAETALAAARTAYDAARRDHTETELELASGSKQLESLEVVIAGRPEPAVVDRELTAVNAAAAAAQAARAEVTAANRAVVGARQLVKADERANTDARRRFDETRDSVAHLGPPAAARVDPAADWAALAEWAAVQRPALDARAGDAERRATEVATERRVLAADLADRCVAERVDVGPKVDLRAAVAGALAAAAGDRSGIEAALAESEVRRAEAADHSERAAVARELARLLSAHHFEKWVLDEALTAVVEGATGILRDLSGGAYSLALDERSNFSVVDHRNADEVRSARTLSGGETFLASLALALALADQIGSLAVGGSARLESIFLDEGFGTLDSETLDTVAGAIEELGARGRMVGLISHVAELAERVAVRFEVTRGPAGSTVTKVLA